jgi:aspartate/methionine/tyrosine aminotransferase
MSQPPSLLTRSPHVPDLRVSPTLAINEKVTELWAQGEEIYHLGFGESRFPVHPKVAEALAANAHRKSYLPGSGLPELREAVASFYQRRFGIEATPSQVIIGPGSKALIYALLYVLEGDVILPAPCWVSYAPQTRMVGKQVQWIPTRLDDGYRPTPEDLDWAVSEGRRMGADPRILLLNSPNNPTGVMLNSEQLAALAEVARRYSLMVISDEVYALAAHGDVPHVSMALHYPEGTVVTGGLSKHLSLGGWRLGVAIVPPGPGGTRLMNALRSVASEIWSCVAAPIQHAAVVAYSDDREIEEYIGLCAGIHRARTRHLYRALRAIGLDCAAPDGGFYVYPDFGAWRQGLARHNVHTSEDLARFLLEEHHLATLPGTAFGSPPESLSLRLATSYLDAETDEAAEALLEAFRIAPSDDAFVAAACPKLIEVEGMLQRIAEEMATVIV